MPKINNGNKKYSRTELTVIQLSSVKNLCGESRSYQAGLLSWYRSRGRLSGAQIMMARALIKQSESLGKPRITNKENESKFYLYAISDGVSVKIGYSKDVKSRLRKMQTGSSRALSVVWRYFVGDNEEIARRQEKKLHRYCRLFRVRGEWFDPQCLTLIAIFHVRQNEKDEKLPPHFVENIANY